MKRPLIALTLALCAAGARAQSPAPASTEKPAAKPTWQDSLKTACAAELAPGGVCAGLDFDTGLEKCLHQNRKKLAPACRTALRPGRKGGKDKKPAPKP